MIPTREQAWVWYNKTQDDKDWFQSFAALAAQWGAEQEREACAKVCEVGVDYPHPIVEGVVVKNFFGSKLFAAAIRKRGEVQP